MNAKAPIKAPMPIREKCLWGIRGAVSIIGIRMAWLGAYNAYYYPTDPIWLMRNTILWTIGPPIWFMVEYCILYPWLDNDPAHKDELKYGQELAKAFWAGIGALLVAIYQTQGQ